jgi:hypothetical protein
MSSGSAVAVHERAARPADALAAEVRPVPVRILEKMPRTRRRRCGGGFRSDVSAQAGPGIAPSRGNPLALLELPRGLTPAELAGGFELPDVAHLANQIEQSFLRQSSRFQMRPTDCC